MFVSKNMVLPSFPWICIKNISHSMKCCFGYEIIPTFIQICLIFLSWHFVQFPCFTNDLLFLHKRNFTHFVGGCCSVFWNKILKYIISNKFLPFRNQVDKLESEKVIVKALITKTLHTFTRIPSLSLSLANTNSESNKPSQT